MRYCNLTRTLHMQDIHCAMFHTGAIKGIISMCSLTFFFYVQYIVKCPGEKIRLSCQRNAYVFKRQSRYLLFLKFLADTHVLFLGHWYPCFGFLVMSPLGFKARVGSALFAFCGGKCNVHSPRSTSGATHADLLAASIAASPVPTYCCRGEVAGIRTHALRISVSQTLYQLS